MAKKQPVKSNKTKPPTDGGARRVRVTRYAIALILGGVLALAWVSCISYNSDDWPGTQAYLAAQPANNYAGAVGATVSHYLFYWLGRGAYMALLFGSMAVVLVLAGGNLKELSFRVIGVTLLVASCSAAVYLVRVYTPGDNLLGKGGVLGSFCGMFLSKHFGNFSWVIIPLTGLVGLVLAADELVVQIPRAGKKLWERRDRLTLAASAIRTATTTASGQTAPTKGKAKAKPRAASANKPEGPAAPRVRINQDEEKAKADKTNAKTNAKTDDADPAGSPPAIAEKLKALVTRMPAAKKPRVSMPTRKAKPKKKRPAKAKSDYVLPSEDFLIDPEEGYLESQEEQVELKRRVLQQTLDDFRVDAQVVGHMTGPVITLFELSLAPGVKVSQVANLGNDVARALAAPGVRIVSPLPGKDTIGIEVPNAQKETVRLKQLMQLNDAAAGRYYLPLYLGKDAGGDPIVADLASMPHMLIAGTTGSGKSVCINTIILSMLMTREPSDVRLILVDPKMVEMAAFECVPHLLCPIVNDMRKAESILEWAATKMDERYELLKEAGVRNLAGYNKLGADTLYKRLHAETDEEKARIVTKIPYYVIIIDELADLVMTSSKEVEEHIIRIAQKARAVGIHLILATQRPSVNVVTGLIKSNMPCRISFRVASRQESRIVLDQNGAEVLLGQGDMLFLQPGTSNLSRAQGTFLDDGEIRRVVDHLTTMGAPEFNRELVSIKPAGIDDDASGDRDDMFDKAVEIILQSQRGSVSLLQRRLAVGYSRASRIVDQMAEAGILGDYKGSQARECLLTLEDWHTLKAGIDADQSGSNALDGEPTSV